MALSRGTSATPRPGGSRRTVRVMIVDDSLVARTVLSRIVEAESDLEIVAKATTGEMAIARLSEIAVDVILLDLEMPGIGGMGALPRLLELAGEAKILVVSSLTERGAEATLAALAIGAADTLLKPRAGEFDEGYAATLVAKIRALAARRTPAGANAASSPARPVAAARPAAPMGEIEAIAIGASTGGIHAMCLLLGALSPSVTAPIVVVQHLPASFMATLARQLAAASGRPAGVAVAGDVFAAGRIYVADGDGHLVVRRSAGRLVAAAAHHAVPSGCVPSVDPLFETLADASGGRALGIVLSGMGRDGLVGAQRFVKAGGILFAQDAATSAVWGMPRAIAEAGLAEAVLPPEAIARRIEQLCAAPSRRTIEAIRA